MSAWRAVLPLACLVALAACAAPAGDVRGDGAGARALLVEADALFSAREYAAATEAYQRVSAAAEAEGDGTTRTEALAMVARGYSIQHELELGRPWLERAAALATPEAPLGWSRYLSVRGIFERESGERAVATRTFEELYAYCMAADLPERAIDAAHHVAIAAEPEQQIVWAKRGIAAAEAAHSERWLAVLWNNLGVTYESLDRPADVHDAYIRAREYHYRTGTETNKLIADWPVGRAYRLAGQLDEASSWNSEALGWAERRYKADPSPANAEWLGYVLQERGELGALGYPRGGWPFEPLPPFERAWGYLMNARKYLVEGGIEESWPEGLAELDARIAELLAELQSHYE